MPKNFKASPGPSKGGDSFAYVDKQGVEPCLLGNLPYLL